MTVGRDSVEPCLDCALRRVDEIKVGGKLITTARLASNTVEIEQRRRSENAWSAGYEGTVLMLSPGQDRGKEVFL